MVVSGHGPFLSSFVGRSDERRSVEQLVLGNKLVTVLGVGGLGKSRLAYRVWEELRPRFERAWAVELADVVEAPLLGQVLADALGLPAPADKIDRAVLAAALGDGSALLLVDNCEHLIEACAAVLARLLEACPHLRVLTTSRQALGIAGEIVFPLPAMTVVDAVELFADRASAALSTWSLSDQKRDTVGKLVGALDGVPLAVELAAVQIKAFSPAAMLERLGDGAVLAAGRRGGPARQGSLDACLRWSYELSTPQERLLWARLSVFGRGMSLEAVEDVCAVEGLTKTDVVAALSGLVDTSLLVREATDDEATRYRMLEVVRQFGRARLEELGEVVSWRRRHRDHYLRLAEQFDADWCGPRQLPWMRQLQQEHANLGLAFEFSVGQPDEAPQAMRMSAVLEHYYASHGGGGAALHWIQRALAHGTGTALERASALRVGCFIAVLLAELDTAAALQDELAVLAEEGGERIRAYALYSGAMLRTWQGDAVSAAEIAREGADLLNALDDVGKEANLHFLRGMMLGWADRPDEAALAYRHCLDLTQPRGERWLTSYSQWGLGVDALVRGDLDATEHLEREALQAKSEFGDQLGIGLTIEVLAWCAAERRLGELAAGLLGATEAIWSTIGMTVASMPYLSRRREIGIATTKSLLSAARYEQLFAEGFSLPQAEAVALALGIAPAPRAAPDDRLTRREREVARLVAGGASNKAVAEELVLSVRTVETHVENILRKLELESRGQIAHALDSQV